MADLIDRAELLKDFDTALDYGMTPYECLCSCTNRIIGAAAVDAAPVVHGEWSDGADIIEARLHRHYFRCKVCHKFADSFIGGTENWWCSEKPNYCPNCGAKMDGGNEDAEIH